VLFGFVDGAEKVMFNWLRGVSGVGPRLALNILSGIPARDLRARRGRRRRSADPDSGVGRKTSERLVVELECSQRVALEGEGAAPAAMPAGRNEEAASALVNLGYKRADAERVLRSIDPGIPLEEAIREALRRFAR
jgi:Holliday junction DNA helicase RuvA